MKSQVIKFVAGAGKTTYSEKYMNDNKNGLYLAFNNSVVDELRNRGLLCKTIDSLFSSFIIPKLTNVIPIIANGAKTKYLDNKSLKGYQRGIANINIHEDGKIFNNSRNTNITMDLSNDCLHSIKELKNSLFVKLIFRQDSIWMTDKFRDDLSRYIIKKYPEQVIDLLSRRFSYIIIDEAQDLKFHREVFAKLLYNSEIPLIILGDENQNINGGGKWFEAIEANQTRNKTYRCTEKICEWIRKNLEIEIYGTNDDGEYIQIKNSEVFQYDDGERVLLYNSKAGKNKLVVDNWKGRKYTIRTAKGLTITNDIVIIGDSLNKKNLYTAITRTKKNCYSTIRKIME